MNIYWRSDLTPPEWHLPTVGTLRNLLNRCELPDDWELLPNAWGNLAIYRTVEEDHPRDYIGYIDLHTGVVWCKPDALPRRAATGQDNTAPGYAEQSLFAGGRGIQDVHVCGDVNQSIVLESWKPKLTP